MEEPTLRDFASEAAGAGGSPASAEDSTATSHADRSAADEVSGVDAVYRWAPSGAACPACGASVAGGWRTDAGFVCGDCNDW